MLVESTSFFRRKKFISGGLFLLAGACFDYAKKVEITYVIALVTFGILFIIMGLILPKEKE